MQKKKLKINAAHLYPELLNIYGDRGNILTIKKRCEWRGIDINIDSINLGDEIGEYDFYFIGGGQDQQQITVAKELQKHKTKLLKARDQNAVFLAICGGYQLFGHYYQPHNAEKLVGIGLLDAYTVAGDKRFIGNVSAECDFVKPENIVGFENHSGLTYLENDTKPIAKILTGNGNNGKDKTEGARAVNVFGTYLHGSFLPKNVHFADYLTGLALEKRYGEEFRNEGLPPLDDEIEIKTHELLLNKKY
jgi:CobQ-like glutamine amidotransferase family enzyme